MERLFNTHEVRRSRACEPLWTLTTLDTGGLDQPEKVIVPCVWESHPALRNYRGRGVFRQNVRVGGNVRLWLGGVSFRAKVYLDDVLIAEHYGAYTGFEALAKGISYGEHVLSIEVDNRFGEDSALHVPNDYYAYGGINRPVMVEQPGEVYTVQSHYSAKRKNDVMGGGSAGNRSKNRIAAGGFLREPPFISIYVHTLFFLSLGDRGHASNIREERTHLTELDRGKTHVIVHSVFSDTSNETAVDKARKLILQHLDGAESFPNNILMPVGIRATIVREGGTSLEEKNVNLKPESRLFTAACPEMTARTHSPTASPRRS